MRSETSCTKDGATVRDAFQHPQLVKLSGLPIGEFTANKFAAFGAPIIEAIPPDRDPFRPDLESGMARFRGLGRFGNPMIVATAASPSPPRTRRGRP
jgi:hypothetical protein